MKDRTCKLVLAQLCDAYTAERGCFPSIERIAERIVASRRTVQRTIRRLEILGVVKHHRTGRASRYDIDFTWQPKAKYVPSDVTHDGLSDVPECPIRSDIHASRCATDVPSDGPPSVTLTHRTQLRELKDTHPQEARQHEGQGNGSSQPSLGLGAEIQRARVGDPEGNGKHRRPGTGKTRIPEDFAPSPKLEEYAKAHGLTDLPYAVESFRLHYTASGAKWAKWDLVWMKAVRDGWLVAKKPLQSRFPKPSDLSSWSPPVEPWQARLSGFKKTGFWLPQNYGPPPGEPGCRVPKELLT